MDRTTRRPPVGSRIHEMHHLPPIELLIISNLLHRQHA
jgi:hypothetical protein